MHVRQLGVQEFAKHDSQPDKYVKQYTGTNPRTGAAFTCDVGYERFLGPEVFFQPDIYSPTLTTPLPQVLLNCLGIYLAGWFN